MKIKLKSIIIFLFPLFFFAVSNTVKADTYFNNSGYFPCYMTIPEGPGPGGGQGGNGNPVLSECLVNFQTNQSVYNLGEEVVGYYSVTSSTGLGLDPNSTGFIVLDSFINYAPSQIPGSIIPNLANRMWYTVGTTTLTGNYEFVISLSLPNEGGIAGDISDLFYVNGVENIGGGNNDPFVNVR